MGSQCKFWLPKKNRFCANVPLHDSLFCGNHTTRSDAKWIPCPIDPSHSVLEENLESHLSKCPLLKQVQCLSLQPFYLKGINAGREGEDDDESNAKLMPNGVNIDYTNKSSSGSFENVTSEMKRNAVYAMTVPEFSNLICKIKSIHTSICNDIKDSYQIPQACGIWINREVDAKLPFQEKHVLQQASILGNLEDYGALRNFGDSLTMEQTGSNASCVDGNDVPAVVEFGAGRGYLTQMLADCYGIKKVILVERKSYKLKADRSLRQKESLKLERLRIDIEDLNLNAVQSLQGVSCLAIGKHLCGPATDMTLRCCLGQQCGEDKLAHGHARVKLSGLAIATCCHHLCQWKHYINKKYLSSMGITKDNFHAMTWFTSWAVDADHSSDLSGSINNTLPVKEGSGGELDLCGVEEIIRNMRPAERAVLGFMCKDILDMGRMTWVKERELETQLVKYVPSNISPENHLLIASAIAKNHPRGILEDC